MHHHYTFLHFYVWHHKVGGTCRSIFSDFLLVLLLFLKEKFVKQTKKYLKFQNSKNEPLNFIRKSEILTKSQIENFLNQYSKIIEYAII